MPLVIDPTEAENRRQWLIAKLKEFSVTAQNISDALDVDASIISNWRTGKHAIKDKVYEILQSYFKKIEYGHTKKSIRPFRR